MPEMRRISILPDSVETNSVSWSEAPSLMDFQRVFCSATRELVVRNIKGVAKERVIAIDEMGLVVNVDLPEELVRRFTVYFAPNLKWVRKGYPGTVEINETELRKGAKINALLRGGVFKFEHQIAVGRKVSIMCEVRRGFIESLTVGFRYPEIPTGFAKERASQLHSLN